MAPTSPHAGQSEEAVKLDGGVSAESLRDTQAGSPPEARGGMLFAYPSGSRPLEGYTIKRGVGRGGFGEVYYATSDAGKEVALKLVRRNLEIELRGMTQCLNLKHPNLISLYDIRQDGHEAYWVVMEYVSGEGLEQILARHPNGMSQEEAVQCMRQVCAGVAYLHDRGIVHRDLKPGNIFLDEGTYKIGDYGLSKFISHSRRSGQTESIGTVHYMAPEIANGRYGKEIDTYALGVIFYEMLTGHVPYEGESIGEVLMKHLTAEPDLSRVPALFRPVIARLMRKDPDHRYPSVPALMEDIDAALSGKPLSVASESTKTEPAAARPVAELSHQTRPAARPRRIMASSEDCVLSGVCGGFANYFGIDPVWIRLVFVVAAFLTSGIAIGVYFVLALIMPSDEEENEEEEHEAALGPVAQWCSTPADPALVQNVSLNLLRAFVSVLFAVGVGCLGAGLAVLTLGWSNDAVYLIGPASGLLTAGVLTGLMTRGGHAVFRALAVLLFGAGIGLVTAVIALLMRLPDESAAFLGVGAGFSTAAVGLFAFLYHLLHWFWRIPASLFAGVGCGLLTAGFLLLLTRSTEMTIFIAVGVGFLTAALAVFVLLFGPLSPAQQRLRQAAALRATQMRGQGGTAGETSEVRPDHAHQIPRGLIVAAVVLGLIPAGLLLFYRMRAANDWAPPPFFGQQTAGHRCRMQACNLPATVFISKEQRYSTEPSFRAPVFERHEYCQAHAKQMAWEARQAGLRFGVFDLQNGELRHDFDHFP